MLEVRLCSFRLHLVMFCIIIKNIWIFRILAWLKDNLPCFECFRKIALTICFRKTRKGRDSSSLSLLIQYPRTLRNNTYHSNKQVPPSTFYSETNPVITHTLVHSVDKIRVLVLTVELTWLLFLNALCFKFAPTPRKSLRFTRFRRSYVNCPAVALTTAKVTLFFCLMSAIQSGHVNFFEAVCSQW